MVAKNNILQITTPAFTRVVDVNTLDYSHYITKKKDRNNMKGMIAEIAYLQGKS